MTHPINLGNPAYRFDREATQTRMAQHGWNVGPTGHDWATFAQFTAGTSVAVLVHFDEDGFVQRVNIAIGSHVDELFSTEQLGLDMPTPSDAITLVTARWADDDASDRGQWGRNV